MGWSKRFISREEAKKTVAQHTFGGGDTLEREIAYMVEAIAIDQQRVRDHLISEMRSLSRDMAQLADALEKNPENYPNDLGPVQGRGGSIDVRAAQYGALLEQGANVRRAMHKINGTADATKPPTEAGAAKERTAQARSKCKFCGKPIGSDFPYTFAEFGGIAHLSCATDEWAQRQPCTICGKVIGNNHSVYKNAHTLAHVACEIAQEAKQEESVNG